MRIMSHLYGSELTEKCLTICTNNKHTSISPLYKLYHMLKIKISFQFPYVSLSQDTITFQLVVNTLLFTNKCD